MTISQPRVRRRRTESRKCGYTERNVDPETTVIPEGWDANDAGAVREAIVGKTLAEARLTGTYAPDTGRSGRFEIAAPADVCWWIEPRSLSRIGSRPSSIRDNRAIRS